MSYLQVENVDMFLTNVVIDMTYTTCIYIHKNVKNRRMFCIRME